jgi:hypothetical protein
MITSLDFRINTLAQSRTVGTGRGRTVKNRRTRADRPAVGLKLTSRVGTAAKKHAYIM